MSYIEELAKDVKRKLSDYIRQHGRAITRNGMFSCLMDYNHAHRDATPSATISVDSSGAEVWYCHVCQRGGTIYDLVAELEGLPIRGSGFVTTTVELAQRLGVPFDQTKIGELTQEQRKEFDTRLIYRDIVDYIKNYGNAVECLTSGKFGRTYTTEQAEWIANNFVIGSVDNRDLHAYLAGIYGNEDLKDLPIYSQTTGSLLGHLFDVSRLTIAVRDLSGNVAGFVSRKSVEDTTDSPKYFSTVKKKSTLFGIDIAAEHIRKTNEVYVVEGPFDCITMHAYGYKNTVALMGLATSDQVQRLVQLQASVINHVPDGDEAGRKATYALATSVSVIDAFVRAVDLPDKSDPDTYLRETGGPLPEPEDAIQFLIRRYDPFHRESIPRETRYMQMVRFVAEAKKINARLREYALLIQKYHGYTLDGILKDIETNEDKPTSVAQAETRLWKELEKAKGAPLHEKIGVIDTVSVKMKELAATTSRTNVAEMTWNMYLSLFESSAHLPRRFRTGYKRLDRMCSVEASELTFISGWPSHGKSSLTRALVHQIIKNNPDTHCIYLSSDDNVMSVITTFVALSTGLRKNDVKDAILERPDDARRLLLPYHQQLKSLFTNELTVLGLADCHSISQLHQRVLQLMEVHPSKNFVVVVDALNNLSDVDTEDKVYGIETAIRKLKRVATSTNSAFLVINHLTKHDGKIDRRPSVANLKGSSFIEYEAKVILLVHMDAHLNRDSKLQWYTGAEMFPIVEVNVAKDKDKRANEIDFFKFNPLSCEFIEATDDEQKEYATIQRSWSRGDDESDNTESIVAI